MAGRQEDYPIYNRRVNYGPQANKAVGRPYKKNRMQSLRLRIAS
jgi:hypothetical protein